MVFRGNNPYGQIQKQVKGAKCIGWFGNQIEPEWSDHGGSIGSSDLWQNLLYAMFLACFGPKTLCT
jgi:hypothetical protein